jgi:hypothetical protein
VLRTVWILIQIVACLALWGLVLALDAIGIRRRGHGRYTPPNPEGAQP